MDIVYILGIGSPFNNLELQYSLASARKYIKHENIYIIGADPGFAHGAIHIPMEDEGKGKEDSIRLKIERACAIPELSDDFLFINDDHFFTKPIPDPLPYYYDSNLMMAHKLKRKNGWYKIALENTYLALGIRDMTIRNYDIHCPIVYNKRLFPEVMRQYDWNLRAGFVIKSLYCNTLGVEGHPMCDNKIFQQYENPFELEQQIGNRWVFSTDDCAMNDVMWNKLATL